jgi:uncharacterized protein YndB with AHSA1/START domain
MKNNLIAEISISINATDFQVWEAIINPKLIKQYMFGTEVTSEWKEGNPITWKGEYEGKSYKDKGVIKKIEVNKILQHTYLSGMSGKEDKPENYVTVTYKLSKEGDKTILSLSQDNNEDEKAKDSSKKNWNTVLEKLKKVVEQNSKQTSKQAALKQLDVFVGKWHAEGKSYGEGQHKDDPYASAMPWISDESYEWLPGNYFLLHKWDAKVGDSIFIGTEIIGQDEKEGGFFTRFFDNAGFHPEYKATVDGNTWNFMEASSRAMIIVNDDKSKMTFNWEWRKEGGDWLPLCERIATRIQ